MQFSPINFRCTFVVKYEKKNTVLEWNFNLIDVLKFRLHILQYNFLFKSFLLFINKIGLYIFNHP